MSKQAIANLVNDMETVFEAMEDGTLESVGTHYDSLIDSMTGHLANGRVAVHEIEAYSLALSLIKMIRAYGRVRKPARVLQRNIKRIILRLKTLSGQNKLTRIK